MGNLLSKLLPKKEVIHVFFTLLIILLNIIILLYLFGGLESISLYFSFLLVAIDSLGLSVINENHPMYFIPTPNLLGFMLLVIFHYLLLVFVSRVVSE